MPAETTPRSPRNCMTTSRSASRFHQSYERNGSCTRGVEHAAPSPRHDRSASIDRHDPSPLNRASQRARTLAARRRPHYQIRWRSSNPPCPRPSRSACAENSGSASPMVSHVTRTRGLPVVVWDRITLHDFDQWLEKHEDELPKWDYEPDDTGTAGRVLVHDLPSTVHSVVNGQLIPRIQADAVNYDVSLMFSLRSAPRVTIALGQDRFEPNGALMPDEGPDTIPTLVLEVACSESTDHLRRYMTHAAIQVAIGVKIPYARETTNQFIVLFQRDAHQSVVEQRADFGPDAEATPTPLSFPLGKLYHGGQEQRLIHIDLAWLSNLVESYRP